jgi:aspartate aminotransferase
MIELSERLNEMEESATLAMSRLSRELKAQGKDIISLSLGEPDFNTPQFIKDAAVQAMVDNFTTYSPVSGYDDVRESISRKFLRDNELHYSKDQIVVSTGAKQSIANVVLSIINPGDEVIIPAPYWVSYIEIVKMAGGAPVVIQAGIEQDFKITPSQFEAAITPKTKMFIFSSPCNPTGSVYGKEELRGIADVLAKHNHIVAISDEIYEHIHFKGNHESLAQFENIYQQVVTVNGVSKAWAMTGWRLGWLVVPPQMLSAIEKLSQNMFICASSVAQHAALACFTSEAMAIFESRKAEFQRRRDFIVPALKKLQFDIPVLPDGAFYVYADCSYWSDDAVKLTSDILENTGVVLVPGADFGTHAAQRYIRVSYATSMDNLVEAVRRLTEFFRNRHSLD